MFQVWSWVSWLDPRWFTEPDFYTLNLFIGVMGALSVGILREFVDKDREVVGVPFWVALPINTLPFLLPMLLFMFAGALGAEGLYYSLLLVFPALYFVTTFFNLVFVKTMQPVFVALLLSTPILFTLWFEWMFGL